ncbi:protein CIP2A homolog L [Onthophagus taurus]|uniref:protein CIP2A homolog L n=1 Tax=Onthophagus taurus TaxID=166361 RepID=UPI0039BE36D1
MNNVKSFNSKSDLELSESKQYNMKMFINATRDYCNNSTEETASLLTRHLQILCVTIDLSIFDPHTSVACEFFVSLHELLTCLEARSPIAWCCVSVLNTCCRNYAARVALIETYHFLPPLSRLLGDHLSKEKKIRLLSLLQELTGGIKILWQIPHLVHLMSTLIKWIKSGLEDIMSLSLGVLVNLCYKNLPALYTLSRCVDIKEFIRYLMSLKGAKLEVHICKLLIICDNLNGKIPEESLLHLTSLTFKSTREAFIEKDIILLRHTVEFFLDIKIQSNQVNFLLSFEPYENELETLLKSVENNIFNSGDATVSEPECVKLLLQFLTCLVNQKLPKTECFYDRMIKLALQFLSHETVSSQALLILKAITINSKNPNLKLLEMMLPKLSIFLIELELNSIETPRNLEYNKKLSCLMELLACLVQIEALRENILNCFKEQHIRKVFEPLLGEKQNKQNEFYSVEMITLFANALFLVTKLAEFNEEWFQLRTELFKNREIQILIAQAVYNTSENVRFHVLNLISLPSFPREDLAKAMTLIQSTLIVGEKDGFTSQQLMENFWFPKMSVAQSEEIDKIINNLKETIVQNNLSKVATSEVMELYEYKLATMGHAERAALASMEAASQRCTHLEQRIAQLKAELSRTTQLLFHAQQGQEEATKENNKMSERTKELVVRLDAAKGKVKFLTGQVETTEKSLKEKTIALDECQVAKKIVEEELEKRMTYQQALRENLVKKEKAHDELKERLSVSSANVESLKSQLFKVEQEAALKGAELVHCREDLKEACDELEKKKRILDSIMELTTTSNKKKNHS